MREVRRVESICLLWHTIGHTSQFVCAEFAGDKQAGKDPKRREGRARRVRCSCCALPATTATITRGGRYAPSRTWSLDWLVGGRWTAWRSPLLGAREARRGPSRPTRSLTSQGGRPSSERRTRSQSRAAKNARSATEPQGRHANFVQRPII